MALTASGITIKQVWLGAPARQGTATAELSQVTVSAAKVGIFFRQLHTLLNAGVTLHEGMLKLAEGESNPSMEEAITGCVTSVLRGRELSWGMQRFPRVFSPVCVNMVRVAEHTGGLAAVCDQLALLHERKERRRQAIKGALAYPICLLAVMTVVTFLFVTVVAPGDQGLLSSLGGEVPLASRILMAVGSFLSNPLLVSAALSFLVASVVGLRRLYCDGGEVRRTLDELMLETPVLGKFLGRLEAARTLEIMAACSRVGLTAVQGLHHAARTAHNTRFQSDLRASIAAISRGYGLGTALARNTVIPKMATSLIEVGEASGELERMLERSARILDEDSQSALDQLVSMVQPFFLSLGGLVAGFVAVATFLPITTLISQF